MTIEQKPVKRQLPHLRKEQILKAAVGVAARTGIMNLTRFKIAQAASVSPGLVSNYFGTMMDVQDAVMREAVKRSIVSIVSQGLATCNPIARAAPQELKDLAAAHIAA